MPETTLLGFDYGEKRIGVAIGNTVTRMASPLEVIQQAQRAARFAAITRLIKQWQPDTLVVGIPYYPDGTEHAMTIQCQRFARQLQGRFELPVKTVDERYSSAVVPADKAAQQGLDAWAAQVILQHYLNS